MTFSCTLNVSHAGTATQRCCLSFQIESTVFWASCSAKGALEYRMWSLEYEVWSTEPCPLCRPELQFKADHAVWCLRGSISLVHRLTTGWLLMTTPGYTFLCLLSALGYVLLEPRLAREYVGVQAGGQEMS